MWGRQRPPMDVAAFWADEEAKTLEMRRAGRRNRAVTVEDLVPWTVHAARVPKYRNIHELQPPQLIPNPAALFFTTTLSGHPFFFVTRSTPECLAITKKNDAAIAAYDASLPKEEGSVRMTTRLYSPMRTCIAA